jgi:hypothetical protein
MFEEGRSAEEVLKALGPRNQKEIVVPEIPQVHSDRTFSDDVGMADVEDTKSEVDNNSKSSSK